MNSRLYFCPICNREEISEVKTITEQYEVKDEKIDVDANIRFCSKCGEELYDFELEQKTIVSAYNAYRANHGLLLPTQIKNLREKYGLSASSFSKLLGFGEKTITRYENGALQDNAQNNLMVLMEDLYTFKMHWERNKSILTTKEINKVNRIIENFCTSKLVLFYSAETESEYRIEAEYKMYDMK